MRFSSLLTATVAATLLTGCIAASPPAPFVNAAKKSDILGFVFDDNRGHPVQYIVPIPHYPYTITFNHCEESTGRKAPECETHLEIRQENNATLLYGKARFFLKYTVVNPGEEQTESFYHRLLRTSYDMEWLVYGLKQEGYPLEAGKNVSAMFDGVTVYYLKKEE